MTSNVINFTKRTLEALECPSTAKRKYFKDSVIKGLILDVRPSGSKSFYLYKWMSGRPERILLGAFPDLTVENARKAAMVNMGNIVKGINPQEEKRKVRKEVTFAEHFTAYMERYSKVHKKSWLYDEWEINRFLTHWFPRKLSSIKKPEVQLLLEKIHKENGLYQSNRMLERIRSMFNKAIEWGWDGINPATGIKKYKEKSRDRFIQPDEMPCLLRSFNEEPNHTARDYFWILLLTGVRRTNTLMMCWDQINWDRHEWRIPDTKNGELVTVPLLDKSIEILRNRKENSNSKWVFPSDADPTRHLVNFKRPWQRTLQKASIYLWSTDAESSPFVDEDALTSKSYEDIKAAFKIIESRARTKKKKLLTALMDIRLHDIRRTFRSYQALTGASLQIIGKSLGHKSSQSTQIYARLNLDPVRVAMEKATNAMFECQ